MSEAYEEVIEGAPIPRRAPTAAHELLVSRLHAAVRGALPLNSALRLLPPRSALELHETCVLCPDLAIVRFDPRAPEAPARLYLAAEILLPGDHHADTVVKKEIWAAQRLTRLWLVDPRYLNVEIYGHGEFGFTLLNILANRDDLTDPFLPGFTLSMPDLFAGL